MIKSSPTPLQRKIHNDRAAEIGLLRSRMMYGQTEATRRDAMERLRALGVDPKRPEREK